MPAQPRLTRIVPPTKGGETVPQSKGLESKPLLAIKVLRLPTSNSQKNTVEYTLNDIGTTDTLIDPVMPVSKKPLPDADLDHDLEKLEKEYGFRRIAIWVARRASSSNHRTLESGMASAATSAKSSSPPSPALSFEQLAAIEKRALAKPWKKRKDWNMSPFDWVAKNYKPWLGKGLEQSHLKVDPSLYQALRRWRMKFGQPENVDLPARELVPGDILDETGPLEPEIVGRILIAAGTKALRPK